jgi:GNAT superfamily N-acetyltransferase
MRERVVSEVKFEIRRADFSDIPTLAVFTYRLCEETNEPMSEAKERFILAHLMNAIPSGDEIAFVAVAQKRNKEKIIGMAIFDMRVHPYGMIMAWGHHLYVDPPYRGGTVAKKLIEAAEEVAQKLGAEDMYVETKIPALFKRRGYIDVHVVVKKKLRGEN